MTEDNGIYLAGRYSLGDKIWINRGWSGGDNRAAGGNGGAAGTASIVSTYSVAPATIILADNADNSTTINTADGFLANVTLSGRTLYIYQMPAPTMEILGGSGGNNGGNGGTGGLHVLYRGTRCACRSM